MVAVLSQQRFASSFHDSEERVPVSTDPRGLSYSCSVCHAPLHRDAKACSVCDARTAGVQCGNCRYVGPPEAFAKHTCPACGIQPAALSEEEVLAQETDPVDDRPLEPWQFASRYSAWLDVRGLLLLFVVAGVLLFVTPAFAASLGWGYLSEALKWLSLLVGGLLVWHGLREIAWSRAYPVRYIFYAAVAVAVLVVVLGVAYPVP